MRTPCGPDADPEPLRVLFVGQMRSYKGVDCLLRALVGQPGVNLTLIGSGPRLADYERLARRLGGGNVRFLGHVPDEVLHRAYDGSDVIVLPSVTAAEAFGLVVSRECRPGARARGDGPAGLAGRRLQDSGIVVTTSGVTSRRCVRSRLANHGHTARPGPGWDPGPPAGGAVQLGSVRGGVREGVRRRAHTARARPTGLGSTGSAGRRTGGGVGTIPRACTTAPPVRYHLPDPVVPAPRTGSDRHPSAQPVEP